MTEIYTPTAHEVETFSGVYVDTQHPHPETINLEDIAHALSATCRYGGHCSRFYSVAEHAVYCSQRVFRKTNDAVLALAALHHDDAEAYLGDIPRPLKPLLGRAYEMLTRRMDTAICLGLGLPFGYEAFHGEAVKEADDWMLFVEARYLLPSQGKGWALQPPHRVVTPDYWADYEIAPFEAEGLYLARHDSLTERLA